MASYKYSGFLAQNDSAAFDALLAPGTIANNSGIYRCSVCGDEIAANKTTLYPRRIIINTLLDLGLFVGN